MFWIVPYPRITLSDAEPAGEDETLPEPEPAPPSTPTPRTATTSPAHAYDPPKFDAFFEPWREQLRAIGRELVTATRSRREALEAEAAALREKIARGEATLASRGSR